MLFIINPIKNMFSWIREKIVGKENIELLKDLEILKGNKRGIKFLDCFNEEDKDSKINGGYEALNALMTLYSTEMNFNEFKEDYEQDGNHDGYNVIKRRVKILKEIIKKYSENNNDKGENELTKEEKEALKKDLEKILKTITSK